MQQCWGALRCITHQVVGAGLQWSPSGCHASLLDTLRQHAGEQKQPYPEIYKNLYSKLWFSRLREGGEALWRFILEPVWGHLGHLGTCWVVLGVDWASIGPLGVVLLNSNQGTYAISIPHSILQLPHCICLICIS